MRAVIAGTGMHVPPNVVDNDRLALLMETSDAWVRQRTGIVTRHLADLGVASSDLAVPASEMALADAGIRKDEVDFLIFSTMTPDFYLPGSGAVLQHKLGLGKIPCLDIRQQCSGFIYGLHLADALVRSGQYRRILLVASEVHAGFFPWKSWDVALGRRDARVPEDEYARNTLFRDRAVLFGDGAGAVVVAPGDHDARGVEAALIHTDGSLADKMIARAGGSAYRPYFTQAMIDSGDLYPELHGRDVFRIAVTLMPEAVSKVLSSQGYTLGDLDLLIMHQANFRINEAVQKRLELPDEKVFNNIQKYGNTTSATIPIAFHEARRQGRIRAGDLVCFVALGSGLGWGAILYRC